MIDSECSKFSVGKFAATIVLVIVCLVMLTPIIFAVINSFKPYAEMMTSFVSFPNSLDLNNYVKAWKVANYQKSFFVSLVITVFGTIGAVLLASMASYKLARTKTRLSNFIFMVFVLAMTIPFHAIMIPLVQLANKLHITRSLIGIIPIYWGMYIPFAVFMLHGFVKTIPIELEEAAMLEGSRPMHTFFKIVFPLLRTPVATVCILDALSIWNDFLMPMLILLGNPNLKTIPMTQVNLFGQYTSEWNIAIAGMVLGLIPCLLFFLIMQKNIVGGLTDGAVK